MACSFFICFLLMKMNIPDLLFICLLLSQYTLPARDRLALHRICFLYRWTKSDRYPLCYCIACFLAFDCQHCSLVAFYYLAISISTIYPFEIEHILPRSSNSIGIPSPFQLALSLLTLLEDGVITLSMIYAYPRKAFWQSQLIGMEAWEDLGTGGINLWMREEKWSLLVCSLYVMSFILERRIKNHVYYLCTALILWHGVLKLERDLENGDVQNCLASKVGPTKQNKTTTCGTIQTARCTYITELCL